MQIITAPYRPAPSALGRLLIVMVTLVPVTVLTLLPVGLGLERYVVTGQEMAPALDRGTLLLERAVPAGDLRVGDVITFARPGPERTADGAAVLTRRIVAVDGAWVRTRADAHAARDPWRLRLAGPLQQRVVVAVPLVGYPFLLLGDLGRPVVGLALLLVAGILAALVATGVGRHRRGTPR